MKLYWGSGSTPCMKVIMVLSEKGLWDNCESEIVSFSKKEHKSEKIMKTNPRGQVPTFIDGDFKINESVATCIYLDEAYPSETSLIPTDRALRAQVYQRMFEVPNIASNVTIPILYYKMRTKKEDWDQTYLDEKYLAAHAEFKRWDTYLEGGKAYLVGDEFTMADVFFYNDLLFMDRQALNLEKHYPNLHKYLNNIKKRESAKKSYPPHWEKDASPEFLKDFNPQ